MKSDKYKTIDLFDSADYHEDNLILKGIRIFFTGSFSVSKKTLIDKAISLGASDITGLSKQTNLIVKGKNVSATDLNSIYRLNYNGFYFPIIDEVEFTKIISENKKVNYPDVKKNKNITYDSVFNSPFSVLKKVSNDGLTHIIGNRELFIYQPKGNKYLLWQMIGNMAGVGTDVFDVNSTDFIVLKDSTVEKLKDGIKDESIIIVENKYNESKSDVFSFNFILENDLMDYIKSSSIKSNDEVTLDILSKYEKSY